MICRIEALGYKCLRYVAEDVGRFHVLVGPNASGKSTFIDVLLFLRDLLERGPEEAVRQRAADIRDLAWRREKAEFEIAVEAVIPPERRKLLEKPQFDRCRYEIKVGSTDISQELSLLSETLFLKIGVSEPRQLELEFPRPVPPVESLQSPKGRPNTKRVVAKVPGGNDNFYDETGGGWDHAFKLGPRRSALASLPEDESKFPVATWFKGLLNGAIVSFRLNSELLRKPSPPNPAGVFKTDGSTLPWVVDYLKRERPERFQDWLAHVREPLEGIQGIDTRLREEDRHRYLLIRYDNGVEVPSWVVSDGTLRMLALTLLAYLPNRDAVFLIEEPENGIHPRAVEAVYQSLASVYDGQVFLATHSPVILSCADAKNVLCFAQDQDGATDIVAGARHPKLRDWKGDPDLSVLFASGVLG